MKQFLKELFEYNHHINQKLGNIFDKYPDKISEKAIKLYSHILNAHQIWNHRIEPLKSISGVWEIHLIQECKDIDRKNYDQSLHLLDNLTLDDKINYTNTRGDKFCNNIRDIFFHIINHSTYHRGQIATEFRQVGIEPLVTDYIFYKRDNF